MDEITVNFLFIIEFLGTFAFAISGIRMAASKHFDWFGAYVVGIVTAVGGGTIRDLLLQTTPFWMGDSIYIVCSAVALIVAIVFRKYLVKMENTLFIFDTIGLALFTIVGIEKSLAFDCPMWVAIIMGVLTGCAGGVLRDLFINTVPLIFHKEVYATASLLGGIILCVCLYFNVNKLVSELICALSIIIIRVWAVKKRVSLPVLKSEE